MSITIKYFVCALTATFLNLLSQLPFFLLFDSNHVFYLALSFGTFVGLFTKYVLDKRFIFKNIAKDESNDVNRFFKYSLTGLFTTLIFWGTELFFYVYFDFYGSQYAGGALGLMIGYFIKYNLDKKYVFMESA